MNRFKMIALALAGAALLAIGCESQNKQSQTARIIVVVIDLSSSMPLEQHLLDVQFVTELISCLQPGDELYVVALTAASFSAPMQIVHGRLPIDPDPFQIEFLRVREKLTTDWQKASQALELKSLISDVLGAIAYSALLFGRSSSERWLILLSDMRHSAAPVDIEKPTIIPVDACIDTVKNSGFLLQLTAVHVVALGVHTHGRRMTPQYYESLEMFWQRMFTDAGAELIAFRPGRDWTLNKQHAMSE